MTSHVEQQIAARIAAARVRIQAARERRDELSTARRAGLARRHAQKLSNLAASEQRRDSDEQQRQDDEFFLKKKYGEQRLDDEPGESP